MAEEPREPHALALALMPNAVHAVVPVTAADERQAVRAHRSSGLDRADAVLVDRLGGLGDGRLDVGVLCLEREQRRLDEVRSLVEHARVTRRLEVLGDHEGQPVPVVGDVSAHASAREGLPPVLDVALGELVAAGVEDLPAHEVGPRHQQREHVLQLVAEAERSARLVGRGAPPQPAGGGLVEQLAVHHQVESIVRRVDLDHRQQSCPRRRARHRAARSTAPLSR